MNVIGTAYASFRTKLLGEVAGAPWPSPEAGFLDYLNTSLDRSTPTRALVVDRLDETPILATAGYQYAITHFSREPDYDLKWAGQFRRLATKQAFPFDRESYFFRPLDLLGICIGARGCGALQDSDRAWLRETLQQGRSKLQDGTRAYYLGGVSAAQLGVEWPTSKARIDDMPLSTLSLLYWMATQERLGKMVGLDGSGPELASAILSRALTALENYADLADAGLILNSTQDIIGRTIESCVVENWSTPVNSRDARSLVRMICDRFSLVANTLTVRHDNRSTIKIEDEYDVQDLLGAILKLHFDDVRSEEWTPSYAGNASRIDFILKQFQIAIEVKMTRKNLDQKELVSQLAIDILRYQSHPDCRTLLCFVYDPSGKCSNSTALENDLTKSHGSLDVVVVVRPHLR
jgi:hypothetical protein